MRNSRPGAKCDSHAWALVVAVGLTVVKAAVRPVRPVRPVLLCAALWLGAGACGVAMAADAGIDLLLLQPGQRYRDWLEQSGWHDARPLQRSQRSFRIENGVLRLASAGGSFLIARQLPPAQQVAIAEYPFLRFQVRVDEVPAGARLRGEERDDAAFRIYAIFEENPARSLVYVWAWELPVGAWSARSRTLLWDFRGIHRKAFGSGPPPAGTWLTVEVNLREDFRTRWPALPLPVLKGVALKADSNHTPGTRTLAWLRSAALYRDSLREQGLRDGDTVDGTVVWFR